MAGDCILCGKCLEVCPLLAATGREELSPRAKAELTRLLTDEGAELREVDVARLATLCLGCHRCKTVCSQGVDAPGLVAMLRAAHPDFKAWLWKTWLTHARTLWPAGTTAAGWVPDALVPEKFGRSLKMLAGMKGGSGMKPFVDIVSFPDTCRGEKMLLFPGCTATYLQHRWLDAAHRILDGLGIELLPADFTCCGSGLKGAGCADEAEGMAARNIDIWRVAGRPKVVTFCASCRAGLLGYEGFADEAEAQLWAESNVPLSAIARHMTCVVSDAAPEKVAYHRPCHAGGDDEDLALLRDVLGARLREPDWKACCGFGGLMGLVAPELTARVNARCWGALQGTEMVLTGCSACVTQLAATAPDGFAVGHWLDILQ